MIGQSEVVPGKEEAGRQEVVPRGRGGSRPAARGGVAGEEGPRELPPERRRPSDLKWYTAKRRPADRRWSPARRRLAGSRNQPAWRRQRVAMVLSLLLSAVSLVPK